MISRQKLYAMGEPLGDCVTEKKPGGGRVYGFGGSSSSASNTTTNNQDNRMAVQDGFGLSNSAGSTVNYNSSDAVKAIANMGTETLKNMGGAIVELNQQSIESNSVAWDSTTRRGADLVDRSITKSVDAWSDTVSASKSALQSNASAWSDTVSASRSVWGDTVNASKSALQSNNDTWEKTIAASQKTMEQIAEKGFAISQAAITNFQPTENKASDTSLKLGMIAAAAVAATLLMSKMGK